METKPFWQSRTLWGGVIMFGVSVANTLGWELPFGADQLTEAAMVVVGTIGAVLVAVGRLGADKQLT